MTKLNIKKKPKKAIKKLKKLDRDLGSGPNNVVVGLPRGTGKYPEGTPVIQVGIIHEFGNEEQNIDERSYLRSTILTEKKNYKTFFKKLSKKIVAGEISKEKALNLLGTQLQTDVRDTITFLSDPPLALSTIARRVKNSSNPLVDTGLLRASIIYEVRD